MGVAQLVGGGQGAKTNPGRVGLGGGWEQQSPGAVQVALLSQPQSCTENLYRHLQDQVKLFLD